MTTLLSIPNPLFYLEFYSVCGHTDLDPLYHKSWKDCGNKKLWRSIYETNYIQMIALWGMFTCSCPCVKWLCNKWLWMLFKEHNHNLSRHAIFSWFMVLGMHVCIHVYVCTDPLIFGMYVHVSLVKYCLNITFNIMHDF